MSEYIKNYSITVSISYLYTQIRNRKVHGLNRLESDFVNIIDHNQGLIHKICRLYTDNAEDRSDLFQEILLQLWKAYPNYKGQSKLSTWMNRVALYTAMGDLKKRKRKESYALRSDSVVNSAELAFNVEHVQAAIALLSPSERALLTLYIDDKSYKEIAEIIGITESNAGVRLNRIKKKIRASIKI